MTIKQDIDKIPAEDVREAARLLMSYVPAVANIPQFELDVREGRPCLAPLNGYDGPVRHRMAYLSDTVLELHEFAAKTLLGAEAYDEFLNSFLEYQATLSTEATKFQDVDPVKRAKAGFSVAIQACQYGAISVKSLAYIFTVFSRLEG